MVTKRGPRGGFLCHCPLGEMRRYGPGRRLPPWLRAGNVAGDSDKVTAHSSAGTEEGEEPSKGHPTCRGCRKPFLHRTAPLGKPGAWANLGMLGRSWAGGTGVRLLTSRSWKASPRNLQPLPDLQANPIHDGLCL